MRVDRLAEIKDRATRPRRTVPIVLNGDLRQQIDDLHAEVERLEGAQRKENDRRLSSRSVGDARVTEIDAQLEELHKAAEEDTLYVVLEGLSGTVWRALIAEHMAPKDDKGNPVGGWLLGVNRESLEEPLIRACTIGHRPDKDGKEVLALPEGTVDWLLGPPAVDGEKPEPGFATVEQRETLFLAAWAASRADDAIPLPRTRSTIQPSDSA